jgi:hypothetical protein
MKNWLTELLQRKFSSESNRKAAIRRILEADDWNDFDRRRMNPPDRNESSIEWARSGR